MAAVDLASVAAAWVACFPPGGLGVATDGAATPALALLCAHGHAELLASQAADILQRQLRDAHVARFWDALGALAREPLHSAGGAAHDANGAAEDAAVDGEATERLENALLQALQALSGAVAAQAAALSGICRATLRHAAAYPPAVVHRIAALPQRHRQFVSALLLASAQTSLSAMLRRYYAAKLAQLSDAWLAAEDAAAEDGSEGGGGTGDDAMRDAGSDEENVPPLDSTGVAASSPSRAPAALLGASWAAALQAIAAALWDLGLGPASEEAYIVAVNTRVETQLRQLAEGVFDRPVLGQAQRYIQQVPLALLRLALPPGHPSLSAALDDWRLRLTYFMYQTLGDLRISEMFDIVIDYPDSAPAVAEAGACLKHTSLAPKFVSVFKATVQRRLLHAGAATGDIIHQYISTIKALRQMDASGGLLTAVGAPIRAYLRRRPDTIRCIVGRLTDDAPGSLLTELEGGGSRAPDADGGEEAALALLRSLEAGGDGSSATAGGGLLLRPADDVVALLIGIYGSSELFVEEYKRMLSGKLLAKTDFDCSREIRCQELLKKRFGEAALHGCEVMVKDLADSKRLNANINKAIAASGAPPAPLDATLLSYLFWPELPEGESLKLPADVQAAMQRYAAQYQTLKSPRRLKWRPLLGAVELDVTVGDATVPFTVTPLHAVILGQFANAACLTAAQLAAAAGVPQAAVRRRAVFWVNNGILLEGRGPGGEITYTRAEQLDPGREMETDGTEQGWEGDAQGAASSGEEALVAEMGPFENYIIGLLTNMQALTLDRLQQLLKLFVVSPKYDKAPEQLVAFMALLVARDKVTVDNGVYKRKVAG